MTSSLSRPSTCRGTFANLSEEIYVRSSLSYVQVFVSARPPALDATAQDARTAGVAPFVDDQTFAIVRIDATRIDMQKMKELLKTLSGGYDEKGEQAAALLSWIPKRSP